MRKLLTEERLRELAGITEESGGDTVDLWKTRRDKAKRQRHAAEKDFFGSDRDPLVTTDVPEDEAPGDPQATQPLTPVQISQIEKDAGPERLRPVAMKIYQDHIAPEYSEEDIEIMAHQDDEIDNLMGQLFGWFHPSQHDARGRPTYDNPGKWAVQVAQEFVKQGLDLLDNAEEFNNRIEKLEYEAGKEEFRKARAHAAKNPARNVKVGRSAIPGTPEHKALQDLFKMIDDEDRRGQAPTGKMKR